MGLLPGGRHLTALVIRASTNLEIVVGSKVDCGRRCEAEFGAGFHTAGCPPVPGDGCCPRWRHACPAPARRSPGVRAKSPEGGTGRAEVSRVGAAHARRETRPVAGSGGSSRRTRARRASGRMAALRSRRSCGADTTSATASTTRARLGLPLRNPAILTPTMTAVPRLEIRSRAARARVRARRRCCSCTAAIQTHGAGSLIFCRGSLRRATGAHALEPARPWGKWRPRIRYLSPASTTTSPTSSTSPRHSAVTTGVDRPLDGRRHRRENAVATRPVRAAGLLAPVPPSGLLSVATRLATQHPGLP